MCIPTRCMVLGTEAAVQFETSSNSKCFSPPGWGGFTPLHYAALHGNRTLVDLFLSNGADPNLTCDAGQTAFHFGCRWAWVPVQASNFMQACLDPQGDLNVCTLTALRQGNIYVMHQMMQYGADLRLMDLQGKTSLHHAVTGGSMWVEATTYTTYFSVFCSICLHVESPAVGFFPQCRSAFFVGDGNVPLLGHRHVLGDATAPGFVHRQYWGGPVFAQRPGTIISAASHTCWKHSKLDELRWFIKVYTTYKR